MRLKTFMAVVVASIAALSATSCGTGSSASTDTVKVGYWRQAGQNRDLDTYLAAIKADFERANAGKKVELVPIQSPESDFHTKLELMLRSPRTAPDLVYEDSFLLNADAAAGYLRPLDDRLSSWSDWNQFYDNSRRSVVGQDGKKYGVPVGTDTRVLWYDKTVFARAGLPADWRPADWGDVLAAARAIKRQVPDVVPMHLTTGKANGEAATMQGFEMLLYGTDDKLFNDSEKKWVVGSPGFRDSLDFVRTVYQEGLGPKISDALSPTIENSVNVDWFPAHKIGIALGGSWLNYAWRKGGVKEWPDWEQSIGVTAMPTQRGQTPGKVTMSGGWLWSIASNAANPDLAWQLLAFMQNVKNATAMNMTQSTLAVRGDVAAAADYVKAGAVQRYCTDLVQVATYRPALPVYPRVSTQIQEAMESVTTGSATVEQAAKAYDTALPAIVDGAVTTTSGTR